MESEISVAEQNKNNFTVLWVSLICLAFSAYIYFQYIGLDTRMKGIEEKQALEITKSLTQIIEERNTLSERYSEAIQLEITKENIPVFKELRLKIRDNRTKGIESWHKTQKEFYLRGGQFVDAIKRKEIEENLRMESNLEENEKFFERQEAERVAKLNESRVTECEQYSEFVPIGVNLGVLSDEEYAKIFNGFQNTQVSVFQRNPFGNGFADWFCFRSQIHNRIACEFFQECYFHTFWSVCKEPMLLQYIIHGKSMNNLAKMVGINFAFHKQFCVVLLR